MLIFVCLRVKLVGRIMPKFEFNLKVLNASSFRETEYDLIVFRLLVCKSLTLLIRNFYIC